MLVLLSLRVLFECCRATHHGLPIAPWVALHVMGKPKPVARPETPASPPLGKAAEMREPTTAGVEG